MSSQSKTSRVEAQLPVVENSYNYLPLPAGHIRCVVLLPGLPPDLIAVGIMAIDLNNDLRDTLPYLEALSYTWGKPTPGKIIECRGLHGSRGFLSLTPNLYDALEALRWENQPRYLWVDQICINQSDKLEKSAQVQLMGQIYSSARRVLVWLSKEVFLHKKLEKHLSTMRRLFDEVGGHEHFVDISSKSDVVTNSQSKMSGMLYDDGFNLFSSLFLSNLDDPRNCDGQRSHGRSGSRRNSMGGNLGSKHSVETSRIFRKGFNSCRDGEELEMFDNYGDHSDAVDNVARCQLGKVALLRTLELIGFDRESLGFSSNRHARQGLRIDWASEL
jgi:hypothetical protein